MKKDLTYLMDVVASEKCGFTTNNIASQKVLEKNGFERIAADDEEFEMNGQKLNFVYYTLTIRVSSY